MNKKIATLVIACIATLSSMAQSAEHRKWIEVDASISPTAKMAVEDGKAISADIAVRFCATKHFSVGLGVAPSMISIAPNNTSDESIVYAPLYLSARYEINPQDKLSVYGLLNLAASFKQLEDFAYQPRLSLGTSYAVASHCRLFGEIGVSFFDTYYTIYTPISIGLRF